VAVLNPSHLFEQANKLVAIQVGPPRQVDIRRAISAAYYATFHATMPHAPSNGFGLDITAFAAAVVELQEKRHAADYDVMIRMNKSDAVLAISTAKAALRRFNKASKARRLAYLSVLLFPPRS
jgi:hypothetical protein